MSLREELKNKIWKEFNLFNEKHKHLPRKDFFIANATYLINRCAEYEERYTKERKAKEEVCKALDIMKNAFEKKSKLLQQERQAKEELLKALEKITELLITEEKGKGIVKIVKKNI